MILELRCDQGAQALLAKLDVDLDERSNTSEFQISCSWCSRQAVPRARFIHVFNLDGEMVETIIEDKDM